MLDNAEAAESVTYRSSTPGSGDPESFAVRSAALLLDLLQLLRALVAEPLVHEGVCAREGAFGVFILRNVSFARLFAALTFVCWL
jgi:hypothetical protein